MKTITIPKRFGYPTVDITINGVEQTFASGVEISVEDSVAEAIENAIALAPQRGVPRNKVAQIADGSISEIEECDLYGIETIRSYAFYDCDNLIIIAIPEGVTTIETVSMAYCEKLEKVVLPASITSIDGRAFSNDANLANITLKALIPPTLKNSSSIPATCNIEVPEEAVATYKSAAEWSNIASQIIAKAE